MRRSKKTSKLCVTSLCERHLPVTGGFPSQRASNIENPFDDIIMNSGKDLAPIDPSSADPISDLVITEPADATH